MARPSAKALVAVLACAALLCAQGMVAAASAAEWPSWPREKPAPENAPETQPAPGPGEQPETPAAPPASPAAAKAGEEAGTKTEGGIKFGTTTKIVLIGAGIAGIAVAVALSGGSKH